MRPTARTILAAILLLLFSAARADDAAFAFPENWFSLRSGEAGLVLMLRSYGDDTRFDLLDESGRVVDALSLPKERTVIAQYRLAVGRYGFRFFAHEGTVKAVPGFFAAFGGAVTHLAATAGKPASVLPDHAPLANYMPSAMKARIAPLVALGTTDLLPPKQLDAKTLELRLASLPN